MSPTKRRTHLKVRLDRRIAASVRSNKVIAIYETSRKLLLVLVTAGRLLAESIATTGHCLAQVSPFEHQLEAES